MAGDHSFLRRFRRKEEFFLEFEFPQLFHISQCWMPVWLFVLFRVLLVAITLHTFVLGVIYNNGKKFPIFLTHWTYFLQTVTMMYKLVVVAYHLGVHRCQSIDFRSTDDLPKMPVYLKIKWVLHNIATIFPLIVTVVYWGMLFPAENSSLEKDDHLMQSYLNIQMHGVNSAIAVFDFLLSAIPFRLYHFLHTATYGFLYIIFTVIYYLSGGTGLDDKPYIYFILDYGNKPMLAVIVLIGSLITIVLLHFIFTYFKYLQSEHFGPCGAFCSYGNNSARSRLAGTTYVMPTASKEGGISGYINEATYGH